MTLRIVLFFSPPAHSMGAPAMYSPIAFQATHSTSWEVQHKPLTAFRASVLADGSACWQAGIHGPAQHGPLVDGLSDPLGNPIPQPQKLFVRTAGKWLSSRIKAVEFS